MGRKAGLAAKKPPLSALENRVMTVLWRHRESTADRVRTSLESDPPLKDSTIRTVLRRLEAKGYVTHRSEGRVYVYSPTDGSQSVAADAVRGIIDRFCDGSVESLLVGMVNRDVVTPEKLRELAERIAADQETKSGNPKGEKTGKKRTARGN